MGCRQPSEGRDLPGPSELACSVVSEAQIAVFVPRLRPECRRPFSLFGRRRESCFLQPDDSRTSPRLLPLRQEQAAPLLSAAPSPGAAGLRKSLGSGESGCWSADVPWGLGVMGRPRFRGIPSISVFWSDRTACSPARGPKRSKRCYPLITHLRLSVALDDAGAWGSSRPPPPPSLILAIDTNVQSYQALPTHLPAIVLLVVVLPKGFSAALPRTHVFRSCHDLSGHPDAQCLRPFPTVPFLFSSQRAANGPTKTSQEISPMCSHRS